MTSNDLTILVPCKGHDCDDIEDRTNFLHWQVRVIRDQLYGQALKDGILKADTRYIATMDADMQHKPHDINRLYEALKVEQADMVIGNQQGKPLGLRTIASGLLNLTASILAGQHVPDFGSGIRVFRRSLALRYMDILPDGFDFNAVLTMKFLLEGDTVVWVPVPYMPRTKGKSFVRWQDGVLTLKSLTQVKAHGRR